jgi:hypothetical protein
MSIAIFALFVGLVAVVGGLFIEYQKTKANISQKSAASDQDIDNLLHEISSLKKRVQNLEAIVVANEEPDLPLLDREDVRDEILEENMERVKQKASTQSS